MAIISTNINVRYKRLSDYNDLIVFMGKALKPSLVTDNTWFIRKITTHANGTVISTTIHSNVAWSDRYSL